MLGSQWANLEHSFVDSVCCHIVESNLLSHIGLSPNSTGDDVSTFVSNYFNSLPRRYTLTVDIHDVVQHLHMMSICTSTSPTVFCTIPKLDLNRHLVMVTIVCVDRPKILSTIIMQALDSVSRSTVDADIMTTSSGLVKVRIAKYFLYSILFRFLIELQWKSIPSTARAQICLNHTFSILSPQWD